MAKKDDFLRELRATFRIEAREHVQAMAAGLDELEKLEGDARKPVIETVFRAAHSLKGASRAADFGDIESLCQSLETLFASWKRGTSAPDRATLDSAHVALGRMTNALDSEAPAKPPAAAPAPAPAAAKEPPPAPFAYAQLVPMPPADPAPSPAPAQVTAPAPAAPSATPVPAAIDGDTVRITVQALDQRLLEAEELLAAKIAAAQRTADLDELAPLFETWRKEWTRVQPATRALRSENPPLADFLDWNLEWLRGLESRVNALRRAASQDHLSVVKLVDDLLENSKKLLMLPMSTLSPLLRKVVRDLGRELGKDVELHIHGDDIRVDKRILEEVKDPLVHLLRNSLDHGIETEAKRRALGKSARANITIAVSQVNGNQVAISVSDDGGGIDVERVRAQAIARSLVSSAAAEKLDDASVRAFVFESDFSTSAMITELSGRGLGLAIVREKAEKLGGHVSLESQRYRGSTLRLTLPLTLATFRGVLVRSANRLFVVPTAQVERVTRFRRADIQTVEGRETLPHQGRALALANLADVLELPLHAAANEDIARPALILGSGNERVAFAVDAVLDEREVLVKRLNKPLTNVRNISGATVLGTGQVAPILNITELIQSTRAAQSRLSTPRATPLAAAGARAKRVLVAEDSITSRMLIKGILESAGYEVKTAVDGMEAFTLLKSETFDVLVSDVEMPRLHGFDLALRVRSDRTLKDMPVILVTALASREDRERGIEVGANAYLVKGDLDQSNLLAALERLT